MKGKILVGGIGNIFLGDDAFGVEVVQHLSSRRLPQSVQLVDFGIRSYDLAYALMEEWDLVILVDAVPRGGQPGTVYTIEAELPDTAGAVAPDAHSMNPISVLQLVQALGGKPGRLLVVGCEPSNVAAEEDGGFGLSPPVQEAVGRAIQVIEELVAESEESAVA